MQLTISTWLLAVLPVVVILVLMVTFKWGGSKAGAAAWFAAIIVAALVFGAGPELIAVAQGYYVDKRAEIAEAGQAQADAESVGASARDTPAEGRVIALQITGLPPVVASPRPPPHEGVSHAFKGAPIDLCLVEQIHALPS